MKWFCRRNRVLCCCCHFDLLLSAWHSSCYRRWRVERWRWTLLKHCRCLHWSRGWRRVFVRCRRGDMLRWRRMCIDASRCIWRRRWTFACRLCRCFCCRLFDLLCARCRHFCRCSLRWRLLFQTRWRCFVCRPRWRRTLRCCGLHCRLQNRHFGNWFVNVAKDRRQNGAPRRRRVGRVEFVVHQVYRCIRLCADLFVQHFLHVAHNIANIWFRFDVSVWHFGQHLLIAVAVGDNALNLSHRHQTFDQVAVVVKCIEFVTVRIEQVDWTGNARWNQWTWHVIANCVSELWLFAVHHNRNRRDYSTQSMKGRWKEENKTKIENQ